MCLHYGQTLIIYEGRGEKNAAAEGGKRRRPGRKGNIKKKRFYTYRTPGPGYGYRQNKDFEEAGQPWA
jgi:hypothetical protein